MAEYLYTIPVNEAFDENCECPICAMYHSLEEEAIDFTLGPSYMEDDVRMVTDEVGFCERHVAGMYQKGNRLGLALMLKTHADKVIKDVEKRQKNLKIAGRKSLFKKAEEDSNAVSEYLDKVESTCFICKKVNDTYARYIDTLFYLYGTDMDFREKFRASKGLCNRHYNLLLKECAKRMDSSRAEDFAKVCSELYIQNMKRVRDDLSWFIDKFDYRYTDAPWKDSKDALQRMMLKQDSIYYNPDVK